MVSSVVARSVLTASLILGSLSLGVGCAAPTESATQTDESEIVAQISAADLQTAKDRRELGVFLPDPKLGAGARAVEIARSEFDGTVSTTHLVKDVDGRLFLLEGVDSDPSRSALNGRHGAPPRFRDARYFLLLDQRGIDWALANLPKVPSTRHGQILWYTNNPDFPNTVKNLGKTPEGDDLVYFTSSLYVVKPSGFRAECKTDENGAISRTARVPACEQAWLRLANFPDPFDAK